MQVKLTKRRLQSLLATGLKPRHSRVSNRSVSPASARAAGSAAGSSTTALLPDWKAITAIRIGTVRETRLAFRKLCNQDGVERQPRDRRCFFSPRSYLFSLPRHVNPLQKKTMKSGTSEVRRQQKNTNENMEFLLEEKSLSLAFGSATMFDLQRVVLLSQGLYKP